MVYVGYLLLSVYIGYLRECKVYNIYSATSEYYTPTRTSNLTSDLCSAHVKIYRYKVLDLNNIGKYFKYGIRN